MSQTVATSPESETTDVRFRIQSLLLITVPVALIATVAGQCISGLNPARQGQAGAAWAGWLLLVIGWLVLIGRKRVHAERLAGRTIMRLPVYGINPTWRAIIPYVFSVYLLFVGSYLLFILTVRACNTRSVAAAFFSSLYPDSIFLAWLMAVCIVLWWWPQSIRLCERGVLWDRRFSRWPDVAAEWDPDRDTVSLRGPDQNDEELVADAVVPEKERSKVEGLLNEKLLAA